MVDLATCKGHTPHQPLQRPLRCFISTGLVLCFLEVLAVFVDRIISQMSLRRTVGTACLIMPASSFQQPAQHIACLQVCEVLLASWLLIVLCAQPHLSTATHTLAPMQLQSTSPSLNKYSLRGSQLLTSTYSRRSNLRPSISIGFGIYLWTHTRLSHLTNTAQQHHPLTAAQHNSTTHSPLHSTTAPPTHRCTAQ